MADVVEIGDDEKKEIVIPAEGVTEGLIKPGQELPLGFTV